MGLLVEPFEGDRSLMAAIRRDLEKCTGFDVALNSVDPIETRLNPEAAARVRLQVLLETYAGDYHTDSYAMNRICRRVDAGDESIWFWGSAREISALRQTLAAHESITPSSSWNLGTVSVLSADREFGAGVGELCRSASIDKAVGAKAPILARTLGFMTGSERSLNNRYHTLALVPRNRLSTASIRGGEAVNRIHVRYVRSRFWGFAPWYVMQSGAIEQLDFRETYRSPESVMLAIAGSSKWYFADPIEAHFAQCLCLLNFGLSPPIAITRAGPVEGLRGDLLLPEPELLATNHAMLTVASTGSESVDSAVPGLLNRGACCAVVRVCLTDVTQTNLQSLLVSRGFRLTAIVPPKRTWIWGNRQQEAVASPPWGFWCLPRADLTIEQPFYLGEAGEGAQESFVLEYLRDRLNFRAPRGAETTGQ
jgi:hypothetical protein